MSSVTAAAVIGSCEVGGADGQLLSWIWTKDGLQVSDVIFKWCGCPAASVCCWKRSPCARRFAEGVTVKDSQRKMCRWLLPAVRDSCVRRGIGNFSVRLQQHPYKEVNNGLAAVSFVTQMSAAAGMGALVLTKLHVCSELCTPCCLALPLLAAWPGVQPLQPAVAAAADRQCDDACCARCRAHVRFGWQWRGLGHGDCTGLASD
jgi:hypothetical protein